MDIKDIKDEELLEIFDMVYNRVSSDSFKIKEMRDMLFNPNFIFIVKPVNGFLEKVENYISEKGYILPEKFLFNYKKIQNAYK